MGEIGEWERGGGAEVKCCKARWILGATLAVVSGAANSGRAGQEVRFTEAFEDDRLTARGWYDGERHSIVPAGPGGSGKCLEHRWNAGGTVPANGSGVRRVLRLRLSVAHREAIRFKASMSGA
jgi:hypothetical protein